MTGRVQVTQTKAFTNAGEKVSITGLVLAVNYSLGVKYVLLLWSSATKISWSGLQYYERVGVMMVRNNWRGIEFAMQGVLV